MNNGFAKLQTLKSNVDAVCEPFVCTYYITFYFIRNEKVEGLTFPIPLYKNAIFCLKIYN